VESGNKIFLVSEWARDGDLYAKVSDTENGKLLESEAKLIFSQILAAVDYMVSKYMFFKADSLKKSEVKSFILSTFAGSFQLPVTWPSCL